MRRLQVQVLLGVPPFPESPYQMLIAIEGIDGSGKTTQARMLAGFFEKKGRQVVLSHEPTRGPHGARLRESAHAGRLSPEDELELFLLDRRDHLDTLVRPALADGKVVILDRYYFSNIAYQGVRGFDPEEIRRLNEEFAPAPDHLFLLDLPVSDALQRIGVRDGKGNAFEKRCNLEKCREIFVALPDAFVHRIDATRPISEVHQAIIEQL